MLSYPATKNRNTNSAAIQQNPATLKRLIFESEQRIARSRSLSNELRYLAEQSARRPRYRAPKYPRV
jgi:hypothetical protein